MQETEHSLKVGGKLIDVDLDDFGNFVAIIGDEKHRSLSFNGSDVELVEFVRFPIVRIVSENRAILVDARSSGERSANAWLIEQSGKVISSFFAGDGIQDVLVCGEKIVVTYFDEGVSSGIRPSEQGLVAFDLAGNLVFEYQKVFGAEAVAIDDCYCACADAERVFFCPYSNFPLVEVNLSHCKQTLRPIPDQLRGASALSVQRNKAFFYSPYNHKRDLFAFDMLQHTFERCGSFCSSLRGLRSGSFLACGDDSYTIISP